MFRRPVSKAEAEQIARAYAEAKGWPWEQPVRVYREFRAWRVFTTADMRGGNVTVSVNAFNRKVRRGGFACR
jgi:hypothetical protein